jgi:hypothetical protein
MLLDDGAGGDFTETEFEPYVREWLSAVPATDSGKTFRFKIVSENEIGFT